MSVCSKTLLLPQTTCDGHMVRSSESTLVDINLKRFFPTHIVEKCTILAHFKNVWVGTIFLTTSITQFVERFSIVRSLSAARMTSTHTTKIMFQLDYTSKNKILLFNVQLRGEVHYVYFTNVLDKDKDSLKMYIMGTQKHRIFPVQAGK